MRHLPSLFTPAGVGLRTAAVAVVATLGLGLVLAGAASPAAAAVESATTDSATTGGATSGGATSDAATDAATKDAAATDAASTGETSATTATPPASTTTGSAPSAAPTPTPEATPAPTETAAAAVPSKRTVSRFAAATASIMAAGVADAPTQVWTEQFGTGATAARVGTYTGYTADPFWLDYAKCNGVILSYNTTDYGTSPTGCTSASEQNQNNARYNVRRMADVLGQVAAGVVGGTSSSSPVNGTTTATKNNRAVAEWTDTNPSPATTANRVIERTTATNVSTTGSRYYVATIDAVEGSCTSTSGRAQLTLTLVTTSLTSAASSTITPCTDPRSRWYTSDLIEGTTGWIFGGGAVAAGRFSSDTSLLVTGSATSLRPIVRNANNTGSNGNDFAIDTLRIVDATPKLDTAFASDTVTAGVPTTITYTVTNTSEYAAKDDFGFVDTLPAGVSYDSVASNTCGGTVTSTGATNLTLVGGDLAAGSANGVCTITVNVIVDEPGTYTDQGSTVSLTGLRAPSDATVTATDGTTVTLLKALSGDRAIAADQFVLALRLGATTVATTTTTGTGRDVQYSNAQFPKTVRPGQTYTINETVQTTATLSTYATTYACTQGGTTIATGTSATGELTIPSGGGDIVCTFSNTPQSARMSCDSGFFYAIGANGALAQVNAATGIATRIATAPTGVTAGMNALAIAKDGTTAYAIQRGTASSSVGAVYKYTVSATGTMQLTPDTTAAQALATGAIVGGAVNPVTGRYVILASTTGGSPAVGQSWIWEYDEAAAAGARFVSKGYVANGFTVGANGDLAFDAKGNLHIVQSNGTVSRTTSITRAAYDAASGTAVIPSSTAANGSPGLSDINGIGYTARGTVFLGDGDGARQFDPLTWAQVTGSPTTTYGAVFGTVGTGTNLTNVTGTDLATCATPSTLTVEKNIVNRFAAGDQFQLSVTVAGAGAPAATATTSGAVLGVQAQRIGPTPVQINTAVTIAETASTGALTNYTTVYECWADGVRIGNGALTGSPRSTSFTMPNQLSVGVACTFYNTPASVATVTLRKSVVDGNGANAQPAAGWLLAARITASSGTATLPTDPSDTTDIGLRRAELATGADGSATFYVLFGSATSTANLTVSETQQNGFRTDGISCTVVRGGAPTPYTGAAATTSLALGGDAIAPGNTVDCTFTNRPVATLTVVNTVSYGSVLPTAWTIAATRANAAALAGPTGDTGTAGARATVSSGTPYTLSAVGKVANTTAPYAQVGTWSCVTATGQSVAVTAQGEVTLPQGASVTCTVTHATASLTLLKNAVDPTANFQASMWTITATPGAFAGPGTLPALSAVGAEYNASGNPSQTFEARPGQTYTLAEKATDPASKLSYDQLRLERLQPGGTWTTVSSATITAPIAGQGATYRFVNERVASPALPLTGGASTDTFLLLGAAFVVLALALGAWQLRRRRHHLA